MAAAAAEQGTNSFDDGTLRAVAEETRVRDYVGAHGMSWARPVMGPVINDEAGRQERGYREQNRRKR